MKSIVSSSSRGFTLLEALVVMALMGIVLTGVYAAYLGMQRTTYGQQDVVNLQQNLRIAMDSITRDIRMAGLGIPPAGVVPSTPGASVVTPVDNSSTRAILILNTASPTYDVASLKLNGDITIPTTIAATDTKAFTVTASEMLDHFKDGESVDIVRPLDQSNDPANPPQAVAGNLTVDSISTSTSTITLKNFTQPSQPVTCVSGDLIVRTSQYPAQIKYALSGGNLEKTIYPGTADAVTRTVAEDLTNFTLDYVFNDGTSTDSHTNPWSAVDFSKVSAVRVELDGQVTFEGKVSKRALVSVVKINN